MTNINSVFALIPARSGSKGLPKKNIRKLGGISLVARVAKLCMDSKFINSTIISTDKLSISKEATLYGAQFLGPRPAALSNDSAKAVDVWRYEWLRAEKFFNRTFFYSFYLEPTSPFRLEEDLIGAFELLLKKKASCVVTVSETPAHYTPQKSLTLGNQDLELRYLLSDGAKYDIRQKIPTLFHRNGACYVAKRSQIVDGKEIISENTYGLKISRQLVNIDSEEDFAFAEYLLSKDSKKPI
jgi:CMP-N,N'-diacetyllegionaminic acid synthase